MSNLSTPPSYRNGTNRSRANRPADQDYQAQDDKLREEMRQLAQINNELLGRTPEQDEPRGVPAGEDDEEQRGELAQLRGENAHLRSRVDELENLLTRAATSEEAWIEKQTEYESLLEEKSEVIRALHLQLQSFKEGGNDGATAKAAENEEVKRLKAELAELRGQLEQDEEALLLQMRNMEMALSRDRAELARQRSELQRMQSEVNRDVEMSSRDSGLRERLAGLQRRTQDAPQRKGSAASTPLPGSVQEPASPKSPEQSKKNSGFFGRLFGNT